jgi:hypothetical protein
MTSKPFYNLGETLQLPRPVSFDQVREHCLTFSQLMDDGGNEVYVYFTTTDELHVGRVGAVLKRNEPGGYVLFQPDMTSDPIMLRSDSRTYKLFAVDCDLNRTEEVRAIFENEGPVRDPGRPRCVRIAPRRFVAPRADMPVWRPTWLESVGDYSHMAQDPEVFMRLSLSARDGGAAGGAGGPGAGGPMRPPHGRGHSNSPY